MSREDLLNILEAFRVAYNEVDVEALENIVADDLHWEHHNRFKGHGRAGFLQSVRDFAAKTPGRYFAKPVRFAINDHTAYVEHTWHAVPAHSDPAWGWEKGVPTSMDTCSVFVIKDGKIVEFSDYG
jgi:ketosteroid isomerase-like protein